MVTMRIVGRVGLVFGLGLSLAGCQGLTQPANQLKSAPAADTTGTATPAASTSVKLVDRDVEAPQIYHAKAKALWDGRPSLGGVWVAAPDVKSPERVIIRDPKTGKFVIGALFRRESMNPGPRLQLSADAATALGVLAGQPVTVSVTALRRQSTTPPKTDVKNPPLSSRQAIAASGKRPAAKPVASIAAAASAAIAKAASKPAAPASATTTAAATSPRPKKMVAATAKAAPKAAATTATKSTAPSTASATTGAHVFVQIGIFSIQANAIRAAKKMKANGLPSEIYREPSHGSFFWRVVVGPETVAAANATVLAKVKKLGFADAYLVPK